MAEGGAKGTISAPFAGLPKKRGPVRRASSCVYLVSRPGLSIKIGLSDAPGKRLSGLKTSTADALELQHVWRLVDREQASAMESALHQCFSRLHIAREWFRLELPEAKAVGDLLLSADLERAQQLATAICDRRIAIDLQDREHHRRTFRWRYRKEQERTAILNALKAADEAVDRCNAECARLGLPCADLGDLRQRLQDLV